MASDCHQCRHVIFTPGSNQLGSDSGLDDFEALIHSDFASLKACAKQRRCRLWVVLYGMCEHRARFGPLERQSSGLKGRYPKICLSLHFGGYEESDEWDILEDERHIEDTPKDIVFSHPLGTDEICIRNPQVIARSSWGADELGSSNPSPRADDVGSPPDLKSTNKTLREATRHSRSPDVGLIVAPRRTKIVKSVHLPHSGSHDDFSMLPTL